MEDSGLEAHFTMTHDEPGVTTEPSTAAQSPQARLQGRKGLSIGGKLSIGFGVLVALLLIVGGLSYYASLQATTEINKANDVRVPVAEASARARANLLLMIGDVRGYLALGDDELRQNYVQSRDAFAADLMRLRELSPDFTQENLDRLERLEANFRRWRSDDWEATPQRLFDLRDDQLDREPAYYTLTITGARLAARVLIDTGSLIEAQAQRPPTSANMETLATMANFQSSFSAIFSGMRGYVTTRNRNFFLEYEANLDLNQADWNRLLRRSGTLSPTQQVLLEEIRTNRSTFLQLPAQIFAALEGERWREDLFLFREEMLPLANQMQELLSEMAAADQDLLRADLNTGANSLQNANVLILAVSIFAVLLGGVMSIVFRSRIVGPVGRLTSVAEAIRGGNLDASAQIESIDELGTLAATFNSMTSQLRQTLQQIRKEKKRADDLLHVVIPIGVALSAEKDFNRLLERILLEAKLFCRADAGILYLRTQDNHLQFVIVRNDTLAMALGGTADTAPQFAPLPLPSTASDATATLDVAAYVALNGLSINIDNVERLAKTGSLPRLTGPSIFATTSNAGERGQDAYTCSLLTIPLKNNEQEVRGVLQLINAQSPETGAIIPFDKNLQQMMESLSSLAVAALEAYIREQGLRQQIHELRIEIDEAKRQKQVSEIVETDLFQSLQSRARNLRRRRQRAQRDSGPDADADMESDTPQ